MSYTIHCSVDPALLHTPEYAGITIVSSPNSVELLRVPDAIPIFVFVHFPLLSPNRVERPERRGQSYRKRVNKDRSVRTGGLIVTLH